MRPFETFRQSHGDTRLGARVEYAAGNLKLLPGQPDELYRMELSYDEDRYADDDRYDEEAPAEHSRYGRRSADDDPYDDDGPYDDPSLYPMPETRGPYPDPTSLEPSALLPAFLGVLLSGQ